MNKDEANRTNSRFVHRMMAAVKPNTEMQIHCGTHGEVMAFADGNKHLFCPECYNGALSKIEDIGVMQHLDKCVELAKGPYSMEAKSGKCEVTRLGRSREEHERGNELKARIELDCPGMFVIVEADTKVQYSNQTGGTMCAHPVVEGHLVPMHPFNSLGIDVADELYQATVDLWGSRAYGVLKNQGRLDEVRRLVGCCRPTGYDGQWCVLDEDRFKIEECGEAWLPVRTPMGPGWLTWPNSD